MARKFGRALTLQRAAGQEIRDKLEKLAKGTGKDSEQARAELKAYYKPTRSVAQFRTSKELLKIAKGTSDPKGGGSLGYWSPSYPYKRVPQYDVARQELARRGVNWETASSEQFKTVEQIIEESERRLGVLGEAKREALALAATKQAEERQEWVRIKEKAKAKATWLQETKKEMAKKGFKFEKIDPATKEAVFVKSTEKRKPKLPTEGVYTPYEQGVFTPISEEMRAGWQAEKRKEILLGAWRGETRADILKALSKVGVTKSEAIELTGVRLAERKERLAEKEEIEKALKEEEVPRRYPKEEILPTLESIKTTAWATGEALADYTRGLEQTFGPKVMDVKVDKSIKELVARPVGWGIGAVGEIIGTPSRALGFAAEEYTPEFTAKIILPTSTAKTIRGFAKVPIIGEPFRDIEFYGKIAPGLEVAEFGKPTIVEAAAFLPDIWLVVGMPGVKPIVRRVAKAAGRAKELPSKLPSQAFVEIEKLKEGRVFLRVKERGIRRFRTLLGTKEEAFIAKEGVFLLPETRGAVKPLKVTIQKRVTAKEFKKLSEKVRTDKATAREVEKFTSELELRRAEVSPDVRPPGVKDEFVFEGVPGEAEEIIAYSVGEVSFYKPRVRKPGIVSRQPMDEMFYKDFFEARGRVKGEPYQYEAFSDIFVTERGVIRPRGKAPTFKPKPGEYQVTERGGFKFKEKAVEEADELKVSVEIMKGEVGTTVREIKGFKLGKPERERFEFLQVYVSTPGDEFADLAKTILIKDKRKIAEQIATITPYEPLGFDPYKIVKDFTPPSGFKKPRFKPRVKIKTEFKELQLFPDYPTPKRLTPPKVFDLRPSKPVTFDLTPTPEAKLFEKATKRYAPTPDKISPEVVTRATRTAQIQLTKSIKTASKIRAKQLTEAGVKVAEKTAYRVSKGARTATLLREVEKVKVGTKTKLKAVTKGKLKTGVDFKTTGRAVSLEFAKEKTGEKVGEDLKKMLKPVTRITPKEMVGEKAMIDTRLKLGEILGVREAQASKTALAEASALKEMQGSLEKTKEATKTIEKMTTFPPRSTPKIKLPTPRLLIPKFQTPQVENVLNLQRKREAYHVRVKSKGKWRRASEEPLPFKRAFHQGATLVDNTTSRSLKLKKAKRKTEIPEIAGSRLLEVAGKFRAGKKKGIHVEKIAHAIDTPGEVRGIPFKGLKTLKQFPELRTPKKPKKRRKAAVKKARKRGYSKANFAKGNYFFG